MAAFPRTSVSVVEETLPNGLTIAEYRRIRGYNAAHPNATVQEVADALGVDVAAILLAYGGTGCSVESFAPMTRANPNGGPR